MTLIGVVLLGITESANAVNVGIGWWPDVFNYDYTALDQPQVFTCAFTITLGDTAGEVYISDVYANLRPEAIGDLTGWNIALDGFGGSQTTDTYTWGPDGGAAGYTVYVTIPQGWIPPDVSGVHEHWTKQIISFGHTFQTSSSVGLGAGAGCFLYCNAIPTVSLVQDWSRPWQVGEEVVLTAVGYDDETALFDRAFVWYRWDFEGDGIWDTDFTANNQVTWTYDQGGPVHPTVELKEGGSFHEGPNSYVNQRSPAYYFSDAGENLVVYPGDANLDNVIDLADLQILGDNWQSRTATWEDADFTGDGIVNLADLQVLGDHWGYGTSSDLAFEDALLLAGVQVPEPGALAILLASLCVGCWHRKVE